MTFHRILLFVFMAFALVGCSKSPSGIYVSKTEALGTTVTHRMDFRSDGSGYWQGAFDDFPKRARWEKSGGKIRVLDGSEVVIELIFDGNDLVPSDGKALRFIKQ